MAKKKIYKTKFSEKWLDDPLLEPWIKPSLDPDQVAFCPFCNRHLNGSKTLMLRHAQNSKHLNRMQSMNVEKKPSNLAISEQECIIPIILRRGIHSKANTTRKPKFLKAWLKDPLLKTWIVPSDDLNKTAFCTLCMQYLYGDRNVMIKHTETEIHKENSEDQNDFLSSNMAPAISDTEDKNQAEEENMLTVSVVKLEMLETDFDQEDVSDVCTRTENDFDQEDVSDVRTQKKKKRKELAENGEVVRKKRKPKQTECNDITTNDKMKFDKDWKKDPILRPWIKRSPLPDQTAYCKWCRCNLNGGKNFMLRHALLPRHKFHSKNLTSKKKKHYDQKFNPEWLSDPRLKLWIARSEKKTAYCIKCCRHLSGSKTLMLRHAQQDKHLKNILNKPTDEAVKAELRMCAFMAEQDLPISLMNSLPSLIKSVATDSDIVKRIQCDSNRTDYIIKNVLAIERLNVLSSKLQASFFSIIADESSDVLSNKSVTLVVRYFDEDTKSVEDSFLTIIDVPDGSSDSLFQSITIFFASINVPVSNILGFGADNCNAILGKYSSAQASLVQINPCLYVAGCVYQSFHLSASQATKKLSNSIEELCCNIYDFIQGNPSQLGGFKEVQTLFKLEAHTLVKLHKTSWLSLSDIIKTVVDNWDDLVSYFNLIASHENSIAAGNIVMKLNTPIFKAYFYFLNFFLPQVDDLNLEFQGAKYCLHTLLSSIGDKMKMILKYYMKSSYVNETPLSDLNPMNDMQFLNLEEMYFGARVETLALTDETQMLEFKANCLNFYMEFCNQLLQRVNFKDPVLKYLYILNPSICMSDLYLSVRPLAQLFPNIIEAENLDQLETEWWAIKSAPNLVHIEDFITFWRKVFDDKAGVGILKYPLMTKFVKAILCLPHSSAATERIFSAVNVNKNKVNEKHDSSMMSSLLLIREMLKDTSALTFEIPDAVIALAKSSLSVGTKHQTRSTSIMLP